MNDARRYLPPVDRVLALPEMAAEIDALGRDFLKAHIREAMAALRAAPPAGPLPPAAVAAVVLAGLPAAPTGLRRVINATGVLVHTNLGRAPLSAAARAAMGVAAGTTDVELDLASGQRTRRGEGAVAALESKVPGAAAHVVNNGAGAIALACHVLAPGGNIVLSRGEMVEIGDGFRIPDLIRATGVEIREVGTTNRTTLADYRGAIDAETGFVLKIHPSNFTVSGFTRGVSIAELAAGVDRPVVADIGSGLLAPHPRLPGEPDARTTLAEGAHLVIASGDKLLGGPQAGLLLGRAETLDRLRRHPLARAFRVDKLTFAALEATLLGPPTPVARALAATPEELHDRAARLAAALPQPAAVRATTGAVGGGGAPGVALPSAAVALPAALARPLRLGRPSVMGRVHGGELHLDLLAVAPEEDEDIVTAAAALPPAP